VLVESGCSNLSETQLRKNMTLQKKGSRRILVEGVLYRWAVRDRSTYAQGIGHSHLRVAVEREDAPQATLRIVLPSLRRDNWLMVPGYVVKPNDLARWIPKALAAGWVPERPGSAFELTVAEDDLNQSQRIGERLADIAAKLPCQSSS
jgi:hypothetical protein